MYVRVVEWRRRKGITGFICDVIDIFDDWIEEWAEGSESGWVEVTGGPGWEASVGAYFGEVAALDAIREALQLLPFRPDY
jgi:hypothetical protein